MTELTTTRAVVKSAPVQQQIEMHRSLRSNSMIELDPSQQDFCRSTSRNIRLTGSRWLRQNDLIVISLQRFSL